MKWHGHLYMAAIAGIFFFIGINTFLQSTLNLDIEHGVWDFLDSLNISGSFAIIMVIFIAYVLFSKADRG